MRYSTSTEEAGCARVHDACFEKYFTDRLPYKIGTDGVQRGLLHIWIVLEIRM